MSTINAQTKSEQRTNRPYGKGNSIEEFFAESVILLTGATGFLGKALVEKLLRSCPRLAVIFILIRPKKGQTVDQRCKQLLENSVFDRIRSTNPSVLNKIYPIKGDVTLPDLGLSPEDKSMLIQRVKVVIHSAATVRFDEPLKVAVNLNTKGTDRIIELSKCMKNLISMIHVSTAYSNATRHEIQEAIYTTKVKPTTVIDMCESLDEDTLKVLEKTIVENHPNTYTFTKNLAEQVVLTKGKDLPISIVRPSIICAAEKEPHPGWVDNLCGITGSIMQIGKGTVRTVLCNTSLVLDIVPVDYVVDTIICAAWQNTMQNNNTLKIYNCTNNADPIRWGRLRDLINKHAIESPSKQVMWYPGCTFRTNKFIHNLMSITLHVFPAFIIDFFLRLLGSKPIMMKVAKRVERIFETGQFFTTHEWKFERNNMKELSKQVEVLDDGDHFNVTMKDLDWDTYMQRYTLGIRKFILNENPESMKTARNRLFVLYWIHRVTQISSIIALLTMIIRVGH